MELLNHQFEQYAEEHTTPELPFLQRLTRETHLTQVYPRMLAGHLQGTILRMISRMVKPFRILEIGTFTGYSTINLALGLTGLKEKALLHTIEVNPEQEPIIEKYLKEAGIEDRVILHIGDAMKIVPELNETWDLIFIDADKPNYINYYKMLIDRLSSGGVLIADNAFWNGKVLNSGTTDKDTRGIIEFNEYVLQDVRVENLLLPVRDGLMIIQKTT
jgi:caffeoyl-CoA O-methyltransferase